MAFSIEFEPYGIRLLCDEPLVVSDAARRVGISLRSECGGKAVCGKCLVQIRGEGTSSLTEAEREHLPGDQLAESWRLACCTIISADTTIYVPVTSLAEAQVIQLDGVDVQYEATAAVRTVLVSVSAPSLDDQFADFRRVSDALQQQYGLGDLWVDLPSLTALRSALREGNWQITIAFRGNEIIAAYPEEVPWLLGLAVDVGTTKLACYLVDLTTGKTLAAKGMMNPQIVHGEDVMSRLEVVMVDPANGVRLQRAVVEAINMVAAELCVALDLAPDHLLDLCLVGNTTMNHLLLGLPVRPLALSPFVPALSSPLDVKARELGLRAAPGARAHFPAPIAGFIGSDHLAFLLATGFGEDGRTRLGIDIGTNTEIALQTKGRIVSCSTASGPAFEGAHINHGMRASPGAIERVNIAEGNNPRCDVIGGVPAVGICGSGVLDALAEMRKAAILNQRGRMVKGKRGVQSMEDGTPAFLLVRGSNGRCDVVITQKDVDQILLAKGAIRAGIEILMDYMDIGLGDLEEVVIGGAFGTYLDPLNAIRIGMLPVVPLTQVHAVGNAAGAGARAMLASTDMRRRATALVERIEYLELTIYPGFSKFFANGVRLPSN